MTPLLHNSLVIGGILFVMGMVGFLTRRNMIVLFLSAELMLQGVAINFVAFSKAHGNFQGQAFVVFILAVAACEAAIALALILLLYQIHRTLDVNVWSGLHETPISDRVETTATEATAEFEPEPPAPIYPKLTPAGREPTQPAANPERATRV